uniref:MazG-like nucleotide pyrophosphohydrolase n=2 Tax=unclassified bacterial viruses TaxID=12333 RepID=A0AAU7J828_9VIRU
MTGELPEGVSMDDVRAHAFTMSTLISLINTSSEYLHAEDGTVEEAENELAMNEMVERIVDLGPEVAGNMIISLASCIVQTAEGEVVQAWVNNHAERLAEVLGKSDA